MDARAYLASRIFELLTTDTALQRLCGGEVRLALEHADPGTKFPYGVQVLQENPELAGMMAECKLYIEWWDKGELKTRLLQIIARTKALLDRTVISAATDPAGNARVFYAPTAAALDGVEEHVWGESLEFDIRYCQTAHLQAVTGREQL